jgi:hypothetical protein
LALRHPYGWRLDVDRHPGFVYNLSAKTSLSHLNGWQMMQKENLMSVQSNIKVQLNRTKAEPPPTVRRVDPASECEVNIQVAAGWIVIGHYRDQTLQAVTLKKTTELEAN